MVTRIPWPDFSEPDTPMDQLIKLSHFYGSDIDFVIAGGGNTSFKTEDRLFVKALGVIDRRGDAVLLQPGRHGIPAGNTNGVLGIDMGIAGHDLRNRTEVPEPLRVASPNAASLGHLPLEVGQFRQEHRSLQGVEPPVHA